MSVDILPDEASTHSQQRSGFKGERYIKSLSVDILLVIPFAFQVTAALAAVLVLASSGSMSTLIGLLPLAALP